VRVQLIAAGLVLAGSMALVPTVRQAVAPVEVTGLQGVGDDVTDVLANFCNLRDSNGRVIFTPFLASLPYGERAEWYRIQREAGSTHVVLAPRYRYPGSPIPGRDLRRDPAAFRAVLEEALRTPSADGHGFRPIVMWADTPDEIDRDWPRLMSAVRDLAGRFISVPAWEPTWRAADIARAMVRMRELLGPEAHIFFHPLPGRASGASDVGEDDGAAFWSSAAGRELEGILYQTEHGRGVTVPCGRSIRDEIGLRYPDDCWAARWDEVVARLGAGVRSDAYGRSLGPGWRRVKVVLFETVAYDYYRGGIDSAGARRVASDGAKICAAWNVPCGFANGLPY
jgi:hypothetical protein